MIISTFGLPGSGKTSASKIIAERLNLGYVGAGDIARELAETDEETKRELDAGRIAPPGKMRAAILESIRRDTVLDGYPRYMEQLADLYWRYGTLYRPGALINIVFLCHPGEAITRLRARGREDDKDSQIFQRVANYRKQTLPVVSYLSSYHTDTTIFIAEQKCAHDAAKVAVDYIQDNWF